MDSVAVSEAVDVGSIPAGSTSQYSSLLPWQLRRGFFGPRGICAVPGRDTGAGHLGRMSSSIPQIPDSFRIEQPWHFRFRPDLIEELCLREQISRSFPISGTRYPSWLRAMNNETREFPVFAHAYEIVQQPAWCSLRWVFRECRLQVGGPRLLIASNQFGWWTALAVDGLAAMLLDRAAHRAACGNAQSPAQLRRYFEAPAFDPSTSGPATRAVAAVGFEWPTGRCQILVQSHQTDAAVGFLNPRDGLRPVRLRA